MAQSRHATRAEVLIDLIADAYNTATLRKMIAGLQKRLEAEERQDGIESGRKRA